MRYERSRPRWQDVPGRLTSGSYVTATLADGVALLTLNRPERRNALNGQMLRELAAVLRSCDADPAVRVIVLTGAGSTFCVGIDMGDGDFGTDPTDDIEWTAPCHLRKPVIAAVNGHAVGAGMTLVLQCDLRVVADSARLGLPFVRLGVIAEWLGHWTTVHLVGLARAAELLLTGELIDGVRAADWGLANQCLPAEDVLPYTYDLATRMARHTAPVAVAASKRLLWAAAQESAARSAEQEHRLLDALLTQPDASEGAHAFIEKRPPTWTGHLDRDLPPWPGPSDLAPEAAQ